MWEGVAPEKLDTQGHVVWTVAPVGDVDGTTGEVAVPPPVSTSAPGAPAADVLVDDGVATASRAMAAHPGEFAGGTGPGDWIGADDSDVSPAGGLATTAEVAAGEVIAGAGTALG